jgi:hypothetical protein
MMAGEKKSSSVVQVIKGTACSPQIFARLAADETIYCFTNAAIAGISCVAIFLVGQRHVLGRRGPNK